VAFVILQWRSSVKGEHDLKKRTGIQIYAVVLLSLSWCAACERRDNTSVRTRASSRESKLSKRTLAGYVATVVDGDTLHLRVDGKHRPIKLRLHGVDCPERSQAYGREASALTRTLVLAKKVTVLAKKRDRYGRLVGSVMIDGKSLAARLIGAGACWHYKRYSKSRKLADLQARAKRDKLGLWARKEAIPPWRYRAMRRAKKSALSPSGSDDRTLRFVGNLRSRVFHQRGCNAFHCRNCRAFFATPGDALRAGFRPHKTCVEGTRSPLRRR
jgi:micrococcal nuclease